MRLRSSSEIARSSTRKSSTAPVRPEHAVGGKHVHVPMKGGDAKDRLAKNDRYGFFGERGENRREEKAGVP